MQKTWQKYIEYKTAYTITTTLEQNPNMALADLARELEMKIKNIASRRNTGLRTIQNLETTRVTSLLLTGG